MWVIWFHATGSPKILNAGTCIVTDAVSISGYKKANYDDFYTEFFATAKHQALSNFVIW